MPTRSYAAAIIAVFALFSSAARGNPVLGVVEALVVKVSRDLFVERTYSQAMRDAPSVAVIRLLGDGRKSSRALYLDTSDLDLDVGDVVSVRIGGQGAADRNSPMRLLDRVVWIEAKSNSDRARVLLSNTVP